MKKIFLLLMVVIVLTTSSFAQTTFSDLPEGHWAKGAVEEMVKQGIISGYTDGTFRPNAELSKIHSLLLLARIAGLNDNATAASKYASTYSSTLSKYSTQYKTDVAYLLGTGVLNESDLDSLIGDDVVNKGLSREEMAMLVTKVLGKDKEATSKSLIILNFKDASEISAKMKPYVYYVHSQGYMNGIDSENFAPKMILTRAQAASVFQRIYKLVDIKPSTSTDTPQVTSFVNGTITKIDTSLKSVWIKDGNGNTEEYSYDAKTEFYVNSTKKTSDAMAKNAKVSATLSNGEYITIMNISSGANVETTTISGTISTFNTSKKTVTIKKGSKDYTYTYDENTKFTLDGKSSTYSKTLLKNKAIEATIEDGTLIKTVKVTTTETITGKITEVNKTKGYLVIEDDDADEYILMDEYLDKYSDGDEDYTFDNDTDFTYNGSSYSYSKISTTSYLYKKGNYVKLTLDKSDYITKLAVATSKSKLDSSSSSSSSSKTITGQITEVSKSSGYIVVDDDYILMDDDIDNYDDGDEDYYYNSDTTFTYNGSTKKYKDISSTSYLYKKGNYVKFTYSGDEITKMAIATSKSKLDSSSSSDETITGEITEVDKSEGYIIIDDDYILMDDDIGNYSDGDEDYYFNSDDTDFYYNGTSKKYNDIKSYLYKKGNYIRITLDGDDITKLEVATSESKLDSSSSSSSNISDGYVFGTITDFDEDYIDIEDEDGEEYTFQIGSDCVIIERSSDDPEGDLYSYVDNYDDVLDTDSDVVVFVYKKSSSKYYTSLIILMD